MAAARLLGAPEEESASMAIAYRLFGQIYRTYCRQHTKYRIEKRDLAVFGIHLFNHPSPIPLLPGTARVIQPAFLNRIKSAFTLYMQYSGVSPASEFWSHLRGAKCFLGWTTRLYSSCWPLKSFSHESHPKCTHLKKERERICVRTWTAYHL